VSDLRLFFLLLGLALGRIADAQIIVNKEKRKEAMAQSELSRDLATQAVENAERLRWCRLRGKSATFPLFKDTEVAPTCCLNGMSHSVT